MLITKKQDLWKKFENFLSTVFPVRRCRNYPYRQKVLFLKNQSFVVKSADEGHIKEMLEVERDVYKGNVPWTRSAFLMEFRSINKHIFLVAEHNNGVIAYIGARFDNRDLHLTNVAVVSKFQKIGIAYHLMQEVCLFANKKRARKIVLEVNINNKRAQSFYRRFGFASHSVLKRYYLDSLEDALRMEYLF